MGQKDPIKRYKRISREERLSRPSLQVRVSHAAKELEEQAWQMPPGPERDAFLRKARQINVSEHLIDWLTSPGLQPPE
jgi:hypothetical protein